MHAVDSVIHVRPVFLMQLDYSNYRCEAKKHVGSNLCQEEKPLSKEEGHKFGALAGTEEKVTVVGHPVAIITCHIVVRTSSLMPHMYAHTQLPQLTREREIDPITRKYPPNLPSPFSSQLQSQSEILTSQLDLQHARETNVTLSPDAKHSSPPHSSQRQPLKSSVEAEEGPTSSSKPTPPQSEPNTFSPIFNTAPKHASSLSSDADNSLVAASLEYKDNAADTESTVSDYDYEDDVFEHDEEDEMDAGDGDGEQQRKATEAVERVTPCVPTNSPDCINVETQTNSDNMNASVVAPKEADQHEEMHKYNITPEHKGNSSTEVSTPGEDLPEDNSYSMDKPSPEQQPKTQPMAQDNTISQPNSPSTTTFADGSSSQDPATLTPAAQGDNVEQNSLSSSSLGSLLDEKESEHGSTTEVSKPEDGEIPDSQQQRIGSQVIAPTHNESNLNSTSVNSLDTSSSSIPQNGIENEEDITNHKPHSEEDAETEELEQVTNSLKLASKTDLENDAGQLPRLGNEASPVSLQLDTSPLIDCLQPDTSSAEHIPLESSPAQASYHQDSSNSHHSSSLTSVSTDSSI